MTPDKLPILILAAGASRRMQGRDKLMEIVAGRPLLRHLAEEAIATGHPVTITLPALDHPRARSLDGLSVHCLPVPDASEGINASLRTGLAALSTADAVMILLADLPELKAAHLAQVFQARTDNPDAMVWRGATQAGAPGHPTLIDHSLFPQISSLTGDSGAQTVLRRATTVLVPLPGEVARRDLDTPAAWATWHAEQSNKN